MSEGRVSPEVFAGAATETSRPADPPRDVEVTASFSAKRLRHVERPRAQALLSGSDDLEQLDYATRENLPGRLEPGQTYTDVRVHRRVGGRLAPGGR